jgi:hypothetical protein
LIGHSIEYYGVPETRNVFAVKSGMEANELFTNYILETALDPSFSLPYNWKL